MWEIAISTQHLSCQQKTNRLSMLEQGIPEMINIG
jgi:hypothetical protein